MSSLWTPDGEVPVGRPGPAGAAPASERPPPKARAIRPTDEVTGQPTGPPTGEPTPEEIEALRAQLARTPPEVVIANHAFGLFELSALHLSLQPPQLDQARLAIDALGALVEGLAGRLGDAEATLKEGLAQLRLAFVQIRDTPPSQ
jgi:hypothetical protein